MAKGKAAARRTITTDYMMVSGGRKSFTAQAQKALHDGFQPWGAPCVAKIGGKARMFQAFVKKELAKE